ncbi:helix-turn-helix domain-containing protein, partial [Klebsiella pneumoniae]|nr:helix-turn-helix domain-containing protein [Klebsiella pneumoniae]
MDNWSINGNPLNFESLSKVSPRPGARLRAIRRAHKDSQRKLGEILGVSQKTVATWEAGRTEMP